MNAITATIAVMICYMEERREGGGERKREREKNVLSLSQFESTLKFVHFMHVFVRQSILGQSDRVVW